MRTRSNKARVEQLRSWVKKHKDATWQEFVRSTGGTKTQYYHFRCSIGIAKKNPGLSAVMKEMAKKRKSNNEVAKDEGTQTITLTPTTKQPTVLIEGVTPDFIWYEMDLMQRKLGDLSTRIAHVMKVAQARDADQKKMMRDLISENTELRVTNNGLRQQVSELTEMINGTPV